MAEIKPNRPVRRFDVFAEYNRLKALKENQPPDQAKGYGIWLAKVVAARKFSRERGKEGKDTGKDAKEPRDEKEREELVDNKWRSLDDTSQTDQLFDKEIV